MAVERRLLDGGHVPNAGQRHIERARDGRCRQGKHVHGLGKLLERLLVGYAEALLLVHNEQPEVLKLDLLVKQLVRADDDIHRPCLQLLQQLGLFRAGFVAGEQLDGHRMPLKALQGGQVVLAREHGGRHEDGRLLAREHALHHRAQRDLGLAEAHVAAQQAVHRAVGLHIHLDLRDAAQLVLGLLIGEGVLKLALPRIVRGEGEALDLGALGVKLDQALGQFLGGRLGARLGARPVRTAQLVQPHALGLAAADVFGDQVERGRGHIQEIRARERDLDEIALRAVHGHALHAYKAADAVVLMHHEVARGQVGERLDAVAVGLLGRGLFAPREHLSLGDDDQPEVGILEARGQRAFENGDMSCLGQQVADLGGDPRLGQGVAHIAAAQLAAAHDRHRAPLLGIAADVGRGHVQIAAVGVHLVGNEVFQMLRRQLGDIVQKAVQPQNGARYAAQTGKIQRIAIQPGRHLAALEQGGHIVADAGGKVAHRIAQARRVLDQHDRILGQIIEGSRHFRIDERQVFVRRGQAAGLFQTLGVALNVFR